MKESQSTAQCRKALADIGEWLGTARTSSTWLINVGQENLKQVIIVAEVRESEEAIEEGQAIWNGGFWLIGCLEHVHPLFVWGYCFFLFFFIPIYWESFWKKKKGLREVWSPTPNSLIGNSYGVSSFLLSSKCLKRCSGQRIPVMIWSWCLVQ